jgi:hypothetical protein
VKVADAVNARESGRAAEREGWNDGTNGCDGVHVPEGSAGKNPAFEKKVTFESKRTKE